MISIVRAGWLCKKLSVRLALHAATSSCYSTYIGVQQHAPAPVLTLLS
jgi:hypothetical protein